MSNIFDAVRPQSFAPVRVKNSTDIATFFSDLRQRKLSKGLQSNSLKLTQSPIGSASVTQKRDLGVSSNTSASTKTPKKNTATKKTKAPAKKNPATPGTNNSIGEAGPPPAKRKKKTPNIETRLAEAKL